jgi:hypothetical protein
MKPSYMNKTVKEGLQYFGGVSISANFTTLFDRGPMINAKRFAKVIGLFA